MNCVLLPEFDADSIRAYPNARLQVFLDYFWFRHAYGLLRRLPMESLTLPAPYGVGRTEAWLESIAQAMGRRDEFLRLRPSWLGPLSEDWSALREQARAHRIALVVDAARLRRLRQPAWSAGIPVPGLLLEMGFGIDFLVWRSGSPGACVLPEEFRSDRCAAVPFRSPEELERLLRGGSVSAVYSDVFWDERVARAGKPAVSLQDFEPGLAGALRSLRRLLNLCRVPFYPRYGRYLGGRPRPSSRSL